MIERSTFCHDDREKFLFGCLKCLYHQVESALAIPFKAGNISNWFLREGTGHIKLKCLKDVLLYIAMGKP